MKRVRKMRAVWWNGGLTALLWWLCAAVAAQEPPFTIVRLTGEEIGEPVASVELLDEQKSQGDDLAPPYLVREGRIDFGRETVRALPGPADAPGRKLYLVVLPVDVAPLDDSEKIYQKLDLRLDLLEEDVVIRDQFPGSLRPGEEAPALVWVRSSGALVSGGIEDRPKAAVGRVDVERHLLAPEIQARGKRFRDAEWWFRPPKRLGVEPGLRELVLVLEVPAELQRIEARWTVSAEVGTPALSWIANRQLLDAFVQRTWCLDGHVPCS